MTFFAVYHIGEVVDLLVGHQVAVVVEPRVETETVGQLEVVANVPLILAIEAHLVEANASCRAGFTIVTISQTYYFRSCTAQEIIEAGVTIVTCTITHILVVGHLVFEQDTAGHLVCTEICCYVVLDVPNSVVHRIVISKELITCSDVVLIILQNIDEREII